jgi:osmotically-inducible protein OsmY
MGRILRIIGFGAAIGAAVYLLDPDRGRSRRAKLADQASSAARKTGEKIEAQARYQKGVVQGLAHDLTEPFRPEPEFDDDTLAQKVRSEALGRWQGDKKDIDISVKDGIVTLKGTATEELSAELVDMVGSVPGVRSVEDHLSVPQRS